MNTRAGGVSLAAVLMLALSGCTSAAEISNGNPAQQPSVSGGAVELAVSESCEEGSSDNCVLFGESYILLPATFERAEVESAEAIDVGDGSTEGVGVMLTDDGVAVLASLSEAAASASALLIVKAGDEIIAAPTVAEPLTDNYVGISLSPDLGLEADEVVALIQAG